MLSKYYFSTNFEGVKVSRRSKIIFFSLASFSYFKIFKMSQQKDVEFFPGVPKIKYDPNAAKTESLVFRHYNPDELVLGKSMKEWLRFSVCYWHTFCWVCDETNLNIIRQVSKIRISNRKDTIRLVVEHLSERGISTARRVA